MKESNDTAPKPDPRVGEAALKSAQLGEDWLNFAKEQFAVSTERQAELDALTKEVSDMQLGLATEARDQARADRERYDTQFKPLEDEFLAEAREAGSPEKQAAKAAEARADVQGAAAAARGTARREAAALGLNPDSGRFAGIERSGELGTALATAGAENTARAAERDRGLALKSDAINLGRGLPVAAAGGNQAAAALGSGAVGLNLSSNAQSLALPGIVESGYRGAQAGYGQQGNLDLGLHNANLGVWRSQKDLEAQNAAGFGNFLGGVVGLGAKMLTAPLGGSALGLMLSDPDAKTDKEPVPEGAALEALERMPVEKWRYKPGVADEGAHVGPYADDFQEATGRGDGTTIPVQDAIGVTMAAVKEVNHKLDRIAEAVGLGLGADAAPANDNPVPGLGLRPRAAVGAR